MPPTSRVLPTTIQIHNLVVLVENSDSQDDPDEGTRKAWLRPEHTMNLLKPIQMSVVVEDQEGIESTTLAKSLFRSTGTVRPCWQHVHESIVGNSANTLSEEAYKNLRLLVAASADESGPVPFLNLPLHPSKWTRLPSHLAHMTSECDNLPLNTVVVTFSDDSVRVQTSHYGYFQRHYQQVLEQLQQQEHQQIQTSLSGSTWRSPAESPIFEDDAFRALDAVTPSKESPILEEDLASHVEPVALLDKLEPDVDDERGANKDEEIKKLLDSDPESAQEQLEVLSRLLEQEELALEEERQSLKQESDALSPLMKGIAVKREQTDQVLAAVKEETVAAHRIDFLLEAQRIRLVKSLHQLYPVAVNLDGKVLRCSIGGLELPSTLFQGSFSDDHISAALGYLCHTVLLLSKYLAVPLRYRLMHQASRSTVQDDRGEITTVYPLFIGRNPDREQVEYGAHLLDANVECLCKARELKLVDSKMHVLVKAKLLYESIIYGSSLSTTASGGLKRNTSSSSSS